MNRRVKYPAFLLLFSLACFFPADDLFGQDFEGTKKRIADAGEAKDFPGSGTVVVFDLTRADVQESGLAYVTQERLWKILTPAGGVSMRAVTLEYDPQSAKVEILEARIFRKDGTVDALPLERVADYTAPARAIYWGMRHCMLPVGRLQVGDALYVKSFRKGFTYALL